MHVKILKAFDYAHDGIRSKRLEAGETHPVHDHLVEGLAGAGYVEKTKTPRSAPEDDAGAKVKAEGAAEKVQAEAKAKAEAAAEKVQAEAKAKAEAAAEKVQAEAKAKAEAAAKKAAAGGAK